MDENSTVGESIRNLKSQILREQRSPALEGIWYYVYLRPEWKLEIFRSDDYAGIGHDGAWSRYLSDKICGHYGLDKSKQLLLKKLTYSMPRGRMERTTPEIFKAGQKPGHWYFWYGSDFPKGTVVEVEKRRIISAFDLNAQAAAGMIHWEPSAHERMVKEHKDELRKILGFSVPY